jgi:hypothetical protein
MKKDLGGDCDPEEPLQDLTNNCRVSVLPVTASLPVSRSVDGNFWGWLCINEYGPVCQLFCANYMPI